MSTALRRTAIPWSVVALAVPAVVGILRLVVAIRRPYDFWGDHAILETAVRRVAGGTQALGPYSRFGFHQVGPAYFDAQAPFYWLAGADPRALFIGAISLNLGSALGTVAVMRRCFGEGMARWSAVVLGGYLVALGPALWADPWQVYVLGLPFLLTMLLAAAATRSIPAAAGAVVGASYVVQTHLATSAALLAVFAAAGLLALAMRGAKRRFSDQEPLPRPQRPRFRRATMAAAATALALLWFPPLVEEATQTPGNITTLARFFTSSHADFDRGIDHGLRSSAGHVARPLAVLPGGWRAAQGPARALDVTVSIVGLLTAGGVLLVGWRRRDSVLTALGAFPLVGTAAAIWSTTRVVGEVHPYLLLWTSALLLPAWIGAGVVAAGWRLGPGPRRLASGLLALGLVAVAVSNSWAVLTAPWPPLGSSGDVATAGGLARRWLAGHDVRNVRIQFSDHDQWPLAAGIINHLERRGTDVSVESQYLFLFGDQFAPTGRERATVRLTTANEAQPNGAFDLLGEAGGTQVWAAVTRP